jgi:hypothetical protein
MLYEIRVPILDKATRLSQSAAVCSGIYEKNGSPYVEATEKVMSKYIKDAERPFLACEMALNGLFLVFYHIKPKNQ